MLADKIMGFLCFKYSNFSYLFVHGNYKHNNMYYIFVNKRAVLEDVLQEIINLYKCVIFKTFILRSLHDSCKSLILCVISILTCYCNVITH